ncbi:co-chaperone GroES [Candidatus Hydrogenedentota bacterium]
MAIKPLGDRVLVRRMDPAEQVKGGIIIPDTAKEKPLEAKIVAVGPGELNDKGKRIPMEVAKGDTVLIGKYSGTDIKVDGEDVVILHVSEILAKIK